VQRPTLFVFVRARPDAVVCRLPIHCGPRDVLNLIGYAIDNGKLLDAGWKCIWNCLVCHFKNLFVFVSQYSRFCGPTLMPARRFQEQYTWKPSKTMLDDVWNDIDPAARLGKE
jgi:hypothetical protein